MSFYEYDTNLGDKLILPEDHRDLIDVLVNDADVILEDLVSNKSGGTNILCMGEAGLGKTLTAEVYSETIQKPLYSVHSGQLGINPDKIDTILKEILDRATRWGAILLLDEADVYIRKRDNSMQHNAIVAAFLRNIERFDGISFMTTNRVDDVDDAIVSRCAAVVRYDYPEGEELRAIWKVLSTHYGIVLDDELITGLVELFEKTSGRDVKELLKLASKFKSQKGTEPSIEVFRKCAMFRGMTTKKI
jgi:AAA+ superfamily predicted ATPase